MNKTTSEHFDLAIVGGGTAGLAACIEACRRGLRVALIESQARLGGTLHWAAGLLSAAGTELQRYKGIQDTPQAHWADVMRISKNTADPRFVKMAVDLAASTIDWLMANRFDVDPACPQNVQNHAHYSVARTYWGRNKALSILDVLMAQMDALGSNGPHTMLSTKATRILRVARGAVEGLELMQPGGNTIALRANKVLVTAGGFAGNRSMFQGITGRRLYGPMPDGSDGSGIELLLEAGGTWRESPYLMASVGGIEDERGSGYVSFYERPQLIPQHRQPWEIYVDAAGTRFMREDNPEIDEREQALAKLTDTTFWIIMDSAIRAQSPALFPMWSSQEYERFLSCHHAVHRADSIEQLAEGAGIDAPSLVSTIAAYNEAVQCGQADPKGRQHLPAPIVQPPFYAIRNHAVIIKSHWGVRVNTELQVITPDGQPIPQLYACGEILGGSLLSGNSYATGMSLTPALSFGRWLGSRL